MANAPLLSTQARNAAADAICALLNAGKLRIYSGTRPANPNTAIGGGNTLLAEFTFGNPAFGAASSGAAAANAIADVIASATATATFARALKSDGTTPVWDGEVGVTGSDINLSTTAIQSGATVQLTSGTYTEQAS